MTVDLRPASLADARSLWLWANDPAARRASGNREPIAWEDHLAWVTERLASTDAVLVIAGTSVGEPVGSVRFETTDGWDSARVSYQVAPGSRGTGIGRRLLEGGTDLVVAAHPAVRLVALVRPDNGPSTHLFRTLGWAEDGSTSEFLRFVNVPEVSR